MPKKYALITGASSGIGLELANSFASDKINLILVARSLNKLENLKLELFKFDIDIVVIQLDLSEIGSGKKLYNIINELGLKVEYLINNAGYGSYGKFSGQDLPNMLSMINLNILALTELTYYYLNEMKEQNSGYIMNVASTAAFQAGPLMAVYYATKAFVLSFTEAIANEISDTNINIIALCPGPTKSNFIERANLGEANIFKYLTSPSSKQVAEYGYNALLNNNIVAIEGILNKILAFSNRFITRKMSVSIVRKLQDGRTK
ncbi:MAG: SDR family oxidoreductase [Candidatus Kapabacteria bacterium]|nr:SDR family oxidoreductase [Candidatus Kapabacteria bacterium]